MKPQLDPSVYFAAFRTPSGEAVLEELCNRFYDQPSYTQGDPYHTAYNEGKREVLHFILRRIAQATEPQPQADE